MFLLHQVLKTCKKLGNLKTGYISNNILLYLVIMEMKEKKKNEEEEISKLL